MTLTLNDYFEPAGPIEAVLGGSFELRPQQEEMACAVAESLGNHSKLLVEAGTGVGKSFAYLLPAILRIIEQHQRVVVATNTIALQEQIIEKDIPTLRRVLEAAGVEPAFRFALVKGRGNYLSIRRLQHASRRQDRLFADPAKRRTLHAIEDWAYDTTDGTLASLPVLERQAVWDNVQSDTAACMGRKCATYKECFYQQARRRMEGADLLICNHAVLCSDLALRRRGFALLPDHDHVIVDEAHALEETASDHFGVSLSEGRVRWLLRSLNEPRRGRGLLPSLSASGSNEAVMDAMRAGTSAEQSSAMFFDQLVAIGRRAGEPGDDNASVALRDDDKIDNMLSPAMRDLTLHLKRVRETITRDDDRYEVNAAIERAEAIADDVQTLCGREQEGCAYWVETKRRQRGVSALIRCSPIDVAPALRETLFARGCSVVLTSATLTTAGGSFEHVAGRIGCDDSASTVLGSPFDLARQIDLFVDASMPDPKSADHLDALIARILEHIDATGGGAFVLFTSYRLLNTVADRLAPELGQRGMPMWTHGRDGSRSALLESFRKSDSGVLLGTNSFWQGVDVQGKSLRNVIITRLPFEPPDRPLTQARLELIKQRGGNPFRDDSLPRAVIRFKQGFGRLIRSASDHGRVVVLDPRLVKKRYGRAFLDALPQGVVERMTVVADGDAVTR